MLYPTHMRTAVTFGTIGGIAAVALNEPVLSGITILGGAIVGGRLPDVDSPASRPAQRYWWLSQIEKIMGVRHRGPISHGFLFNTLVFGIIWYSLWNYKGEPLLGFGLTVLALTFTFKQFYQTFREYILSIPKNPGGFVSYIMIDSDKYAGRDNGPHLRPLNLMSVYPLAFTVALVVSLLMKSPNMVEGADYFLGVWIGVLSHLFADAITKQGIQINNKKFHVLGILSKHIKTGSGTELWFRAFFTITSVLGIIALAGTMITHFDMR